MQSVFIKFLTHEDRVRGFYELATRARIGSFPGEIYQVPIEALKSLTDQQVSYRRATDAEVKGGHDQVRNPTPLFYNDGRPVERENFVQTDLSKTRFQQLDIWITAHRIEIV